jgi:hypothetical protein
LKKVIGFLWSFIPTKIEAILKLSLLFADKCFCYSSRSETQDLRKMQTSFFSLRGILPEMSASRLESGIVDKSRLSVGDDFAGLYRNFSLAVVFLRTFYPLIYRIFFSQIIQIVI